MNEDQNGSERLFKDHVEKWRQRVLASPKAMGAADRVITMSMEPGSGGRIIAEKLAQRLGFDLFHREIIKAIAKSSRMSASVIDTVEKERLSGLEDFLSSLIRKKYFHPGSYQHHLFKVIGTVARHGRVVIVGRGANFILPPAERLAVRVIAPLETRIRNVARGYGCTLEVAEKRVRQRQARRRDFVRQAFHQNIDKPHHYDLVVNTGQLSLDTAVEAILAVHAHRNGDGRPPA
ncbi:MAG: cytidylate kinase-like family protein [Deltaproteobacteria bacterium]|nr:cytidylate kinase-like family protein [Deltaproteobacteria bacterium]